jgi:hypothetical protein
MASSFGKTAYLGAAVDLAVEVRDRIGRLQLGLMLGRKGHEHIDLGFVQRVGELGWLSAKPVGNVAPLRPARPTHRPGKKAMAMNETNAGRCRRHEPAHRPSRAGGTNQLHAATSFLRGEGGVLIDRLRWRQPSRAAAA